MATLADLLRSGYTPPTESPMTDVVKDYVAAIPQKFQENAINTNNMVQNAMPYDFATHSFQKGPTYEEFLNYAPNLMGATAWHGTPHKIQGAFDISKIGTGEGAQAYGHGMYFAENPAVAKEYQKLDPAGGPTAPTRRTLNGVELEPGTPEYHAGTLLSRNGVTLKSAKDMVKSWIDDPSAMSAGEKTVEGWKKTLETLNSIPKKTAFKELPHEGNLYKVDIPDEHIPNMLDWDKKVPEDLRKRISAKTMEQFGNGATGTSGEHLYKEIVFEMRRNGSKNPEADASKWLNENSVTGIRYLDYGSRGVDAKKTSNFVVFDPSTVKILEENGKPLTRKELIEEQINKLKD